MMLTLIVAIEKSSNCGEKSNTEHLEVLHESAGAATAHESLAALQGGVVEAAMINCSATHVG